jgi:hypothetical protein
VTRLRSTTRQATVCDIPVFLLLWSTKSQSPPRRRLLWVVLGNPEESHGSHGSLWIHSESMDYLSALWNPQQGIQRNPADPVESFCSQFSR